MWPDIPVSRETEEKLKVYEGLLAEWQEKMNLVSPASLPHAWERHFLDSIQLLPFIPETTRKLVDFGSGAGFPGLVLAVCLPDISFQLVESIGKKCRFLEAVKDALQLTNVHIRPERVETLVSRESPPDMVTARAVSALKDLLGYMVPWARQNKQISLIFPKGAKAVQEIEDAKSVGFRFHVEQSQSRTDPSAQILVVKNLAFKG